MDNSHLRLANDTMMGQNSRVFYVDHEGKETDISDVVRSITVTSTAGELNVATLDVIKVKYALLAKEA